MAQWVIRWTNNTSPMHFGTVVIHMTIIGKHSWCLLGCSIGDLGTIAYFQYTGIPGRFGVMTLAICNGLLTSITRDSDPAASDDLKRSLQDRDRHVIDLDDRHGISDESSRCGRNGRRHFDSRSDTADVASGISRPLAI